MGVSWQQGVMPLRRQEVVGRERLTAFQTDRPQVRQNPNQDFSSIVLMSITVVCSSSCAQTKSVSSSFRNHSCSLLRRRSEHENEPRWLL